MADKVIITLEMPLEAAKRLEKLFKDKDPELMKMCEELKIEAIDNKDKEQPKWKNSILILHEGLQKGAKQKNFSDFHWNGKPILVLSVWEF